MEFEWDEVKNEINKKKHGVSFEEAKTVFRACKEHRTMNERDEFLEKEFDFSKAIKNPYAKTLKKQVTINLDEKVIIYFKNKAEDTGIPYQTLINLYLKDCVTNNRNLELTWK